MDTIISCVDGDKNTHKIDVNMLNPQGKSADDQKKLGMLMSEFDATIELLKEGGLGGPASTCNVAAVQSSARTPKKGQGESRVHVVTPDRSGENVSILPTISLDGIGTNATLRRCILEDLFRMKEGHRVLVVCCCGPYDPTHYGLPAKGPHIHSRGDTIFAKGGKYMHIYGVVSGSNERGEDYLSDHTDKSELIKKFETRGDAIIIDIPSTGGATIQVKYKDIIDCTSEIWDVSTNNSSSRDFQKLFTYEADTTASPPSYLCTKRTNPKGRIALARMLPLLRRIAKEIR